MKRFFWIYIITMILASALLLQAFADQVSPVGGVGIGGVDISGAGKMTEADSTEEATSEEEMTESDGDVPESGPEQSGPEETEPDEETEPAAPSGGQHYEFDNSKYAGIELDENLVIADGIYIGEDGGDMLSLSGMHPSEAREAAEEFYYNIVSAPVTIKAGSETIMTSLEEMGLDYDTDGIAEQAAFLGQYGGLIKRYKELADIKVDKVVFTASYELSGDRVDAFIRDFISSRDAEVKEASITREDGEFVVSPSVLGWHTQVEETKNNIFEAVYSGLRTGIEIEAAVETERPYRTTEALSQIQNRLGTYTTDYSSSNAGRKKNIKVASGNLNGIVVMPGDSLSVSTSMKERTPENGYELASEYLNGESVDAYGGGVCQVASTLYNALLKAELQIDKRSNHSMLVRYVQPSFDAAISWGSKDLVFTNNTEAPVYIATSCDGAELTISVYGKEYRSPNRKVVYTSVEVERIPSESITKEDPNQPVGFIEKKGSNHDQCTSYLKKTIYEDGEVVDIVEFKTDYYNASYETITIGTFVDPNAPVPQTDENGNPVDPGTDDGQPTDPPADDGEGDGGEEPESPEPEPTEPEPTEPEETEAEETEPESESEAEE